MLLVTSFSELLHLFNFDLKSVAQLADDFMSDHQEFTLFIGLSSAVTVVVDLLFAKNICITEIAALNIGDKGY